MRTVPFFTALFLSLAACAAGKTPPPPACEESAQGFREQCGPRMLALSVRIAAYSDGVACTAASECATVAIGTKLCGGPLAYVPYARTDADVGAFLEDVAEYNRLGVVQARHQAQAGMLSDCVLVEDPGAACVDKRCVLEGSR